MGFIDIMTTESHEHIVNIDQIRDIQMWDNDIVIINLVGGGYLIAFANYEKLAEALRLMDQNGDRSNYAIQK